MTAKYAIFDLDGTLIDFEGISGQALKTVTNRSGNGTLEFTSDLHASILGTPSSYWSKKLITDLEITAISADQLVEEYHRELEILFPSLQLMPGASELLRHLKSRNIPIAIATSSASYTVPKKIAHIPILSECIDLIVTGDDPEVKRENQVQIFFKSQQIG